MSGDDFGKVRQVDRDGTPNREDCPVLWWRPQGLPIVMSSSAWDVSNRNGWDKNIEWIPVREIADGLPRTEPKVQIEIPLSVARRFSMAQFVGDVPIAVQKLVKEKL